MKNVVVTIPTGMDLNLVARKLRLSGFNIIAHKFGESVKVEGRDAQVAQRMLAIAGIK